LLLLIIYNEPDIGVGLVEGGALIEFINNLQLLPGLAGPLKT